MNNNIKLIGYILLTALLVLAQASAVQILIILAAIYAGWRLLVLVSHGMTCSTCQFKFLSAVAILISVLVMQAPRIAYLLIAVVWIDYFSKDTNEKNTATFY